MDAIALLEADHKRVKALFKDFRAAGDRAHKKKQSIAEQAFTELQAHTEVEEEVFYPAVRKRGGELADMIAESLEEHHVVKLLMKELEALTPEDETYEAKFTVLMENVEHHVEEEEEELFPKVKKQLGADLDELGEEMAERKQKLEAAAKR